MIKPFTTFLSFLILTLLIISCEKEPQIAYNYNIYIPDTNFKNALFDVYIDETEYFLDNNKDGEISDGEAAFVDELYLSNLNIKDLTGISEFINLRTLYCGSNQIKKLDLSYNTKIQRLSCSNNELTELILTKCPNLRSLYCSSNQLKFLDLSNNAKLSSFSCSNNEIYELDLSSNINIELLGVSGNKISEIDFKNNLKLESIIIYNNLLQTVDLSCLPDLSALWIGGNQFVIIDISNNPNCDFIRLEAEEPLLEEICVWDMQYPTEKLNLVGFDDYSIFKFCD